MYALDSTISALVIALTAFLLATRSLILNTRRESRHVVDIYFMDLRNDDSPLDLLDDVNSLADWPSIVFEEARGISDYEKQANIL